jgi:hypothetical protein
MSMACRICCCLGSSVVCMRKERIMPPPLPAVRPSASRPRALSKGLRGGQGRGGASGGDGGGEASGLRCCCCSPGVSRPLYAACCSVAAQQDEARRWPLAALSAAVGCCYDELAGRPRLTTWCWRGGERPGQPAVRVANKQRTDGVRGAMQSKRDFRDACECIGMAMARCWCAQRQHFPPQGGGGSGMGTGSRAGPLGSAWEHQPQLSGTQCEHKWARVCQSRRAVYWQNLGKASGGRAELGCGGWPPTSAVAMKAAT